MAVAGYNSQVLIASLPSVPTTFEVTNTSDLITFTITNAAHRYFDPAAAVVVRSGLDEIQQVAITGSPTGGSFTLTFGGQTTVQTRLAALSSIGAGNVGVSGGPGPATPFVVEFKGALGPNPQALMTHTDSFTGGSSPAAAVTRLQGGVALAIITAGFVVFRCNARVVFGIAQPSGTVVKIDGSYFPYAQIAEAASCEFSGKMNTEDTTTFQSAAASNGAKSFTPTTLEGTLKYGSFWLNIARAQSLVARDLLVVSFQTPPGNRYEGYCLATDCNIKTDVNKVVTQDLAFQLTNEFFNS